MALLGEGGGGLACWVRWNPLSKPRSLFAVQNFRLLKASMPLDSPSPPPPPHTHTHTQKK